MPRALRRWSLHAAQTDARGRGSGDTGFVEVTQEVAASMTNEAGVLEIEVGRVLLRIRGHVEADVLGRVLDVLKGRR
ncbi:hypothetical protein OV203_34225 [Nannocystis sp. ILAH1]|uniref:hypothetical protein n=1 Tax=unclassified Nannocystis TaxID=2627009 RepID=UPI00226FF9F8|nr:MULTISPECIES: hypothetical protein [unclassified Nannocystis]MCY0992245.1 hypothetical protein [Nannocystis sp. ILAH1]MCY1069167.1 hypothetical protein [Nannocystis sp. RBIL2]